MTNVGPRGDPIATLSICWYISSLGLKNAASFVHSCNNFQVFLLAPLVEVNLGGYKHVGWLYQSLGL